MQDYLIIAFLGALVTLDTTVAGQFMIAQPLISAAILGFFLGDLESGIYVGVIMQLMWLKLIPAGGSIYLNGNLGTMAAVSVLELSANDFSYSEDALRFTVILYGIAASYIFGYFTTLQRRINGHLICAAHKAIDHAHLSRFQCAHFLGAIITGFAGMIIAVTSAFIGKWLVFQIPAVYFSALGSFFPYGIIAFLGIGMGTVFSMIWTRKAWYYPLLGMFAGILLLFIL